MGMLAASKAAYRKGWSNEDCTIPLWQTLERYGIDPKCPFGAEELASAALKDKKRNGSTISLVIPLQIGEGAIMDIKVEELLEFFRLGLEG
jgi:3-dehydroquinate synthetase